MGIGEAAQILSGGILQAKPAAVRNHVSAKPLVSRESFAMSINPQWDAEIGPPKGSSLKDVTHGQWPKVIPPLSKRIRVALKKGKVQFGKLLDESYKAFNK